MGHTRAFDYTFKGLFRSFVGSPNQKFSALRMRSLWCQFAKKKNRRDRIQKQSGALNLNRTRRSDARVLGWLRGVRGLAGVRLRSYAGFVAVLCGFLAFVGSLAFNAKSPIHEPVGENALT